MNNKKEIKNEIACFNSMKIEVGKRFDLLQNIGICNNVRIQGIENYIEVKSDNCQLPLIPKDFYILVSWQNIKKMNDYDKIIKFIGVDSPCIKFTNIDNQGNEFRVIIPKHYIGLNNYNSVFKNNSSLKANSSQLKFIDYCSAYCENEQIYS